MFILQEKYLFDNVVYWYDLYECNDLLFLKDLRSSYEKNHLLSVYRIVKVF